MTEIIAEIDLIGMARKIDRIEQAVLGNGVKGLCGRVTDLETNEKKQGRLIGICSGVCFVIGGVFTYLINFFKG